MYGLPIPIKVEKGPLFSPDVLIKRVRNYPSIPWWINGQTEYSLCTMQYHSALKSKKILGNSLVGQWLELCALNAKDLGSVPGQWTKIPQGEWHSQKKKSKEILSHATTWMNLEDIILSEISQSQKDKHCMIPLIWGTRVVTFIQTESRMMVTRGLERGMGS